MVMVPGGAEYIEKRVRAGKLWDSLFYTITIQNMFHDMKYKIARCTLRQNNKVAKLFRTLRQKKLAFLLKSDKINVKLFLRCGQMFAEKGRIFLRKSETCGGEKQKRRD